MTIDANQEIDEIEGLGTTDNEIESNDPADSSSDSGESHEKNHSGFQKRIDEITAKRYQAERRAEELEKRLAEIEAQANKAKPVESTIVRPELPSDIYDEDAMRKYHASMIEYQESVAEVKAKSVWESQQEAIKKSRQQEESVKLIEQWASNAQKQGVDIDKLAAAEKVVNSAGISPELASYLMRDSAGPSVVAYLADNPAEMYEVLQMHPIDASVKIATEIKAKALSKTPKVSKSPDPIPDIKGGGALEVDDFERKYGKPEFI